jgi:hypothetical protein
MIYIGVDLHLRFCYMTALDARGTIQQHGRVARTALARKLLGAVYALWKHGVCFDEQIFAAM